ncbi:MAG: hypothetical protein K8T89_24350, partial [Planctomycetes bacterium]|nr:hypothetical protein [Planctomycetota bacterium]
RARSASKGERSPLLALRARESAFQVPFSRFPSNSGPDRLPFEIGKTLIRFPPEPRVRNVNIAENVAAWFTGAGLLLALLGWRISEPILLWCGIATTVIGILLWFRRNNRRSSSRWTKENEDV